MTTNSANASLPDMKLQGCRSTSEPEEIFADNAAACSGCRSGEWTYPLKRPTGGRKATEPAKAPSPLSSRLYRLRSLSDVPMYAYH
jgi:hypothetical protein